MSAFGTIPSYLLVTGSTGAQSPACPVTPRAPLPPFPPGQYDRTLTQAIPPTSDKQWFRGNFCGIWVPGSPGIPGGYNWSLGGPFGLVWGPDLLKYPVEWQHKILCQYVQDGYTHFLWQWDPSYLTEETFVAGAKLIQSYGLYADIWFASKTYCPRDAPGTWYQQNFQSLVKKLLDAGAIDTACVGFELNEYNGDQFQEVIDVFAGWLQPKIPLYVHFDVEVTWWGPYPGRFDFWKAQAGKINGIHYQADVNWTIQELQARMCDTLNPFGDGRMGQFAPGVNYRFVGSELTAMKAFFTPTDIEDQCDQTGYLALCTQAASPVCGFYNGARRPDGTAL